MELVLFISLWSVDVNDVSVCRQGLESRAAALNGDCNRRSSLGLAGY